VVDLEPPPSLTPRRRASLALASWLSIIPGLGQLYNRQPRKGLIFLGGVIGLFFLSLNVPALTDALLAWWRPRGGVAVALSLTVQMISLLVFVGIFLGALAFWYAAMHDARLTARVRNGEMAKSGRWWFFHR
jgi:arabinogalactan oligomer / maltooligosaccharide transport system permease protein